MARLPVSRLLPVALAVGIAVSLTGCQPASTPAPTAVRSTDLAGSDAGFDEHAVIGVLLVGDEQVTSSGTASYASRFRSELTEAGFRPDVRTASGTGAAQDQRADVHALVRSGAKVIIIDEANPASLASQLQYAHDAGATVIAITSESGSEKASVEHADYAIVEGTGIVTKTVSAVEQLQRGKRPNS